MIERENGGEYFGPSTPYLLSACIMALSLFVQSTVYRQHLLQRHFRYNDAFCRNRTYLSHKDARYNDTNSFDQARRCNKGRLYNYYLSRARLLRFFRQNRPII
jgi:hypothetical protein